MAGHAGELGTSHRQSRRRHRAGVVWQRRCQCGREPHSRTQGATAPPIREACEAFIRSQRGEGWRLIETAYDDGGLSGGTLQRPALQRLFADIAQHRVDTVLVYKVDPLTRSLMDFAKIVELFDRHRVSFVAVTQQFNTTTSIGMLTLNILLSFAQFEREVIGERVRDKIAASKKKGLWMGGLTPLGYEVRHHK